MEHRCPPLAHVPRERAWTRLRRLGALRLRALRPVPLRFWPLRFWPLRFWPLRFWPLRLGAFAVVFLLLPALLLGVGVRAAADEDAPRTPAEIRAFVKQCLADLRSSSFEVRDAARQGLEEHGEAARDLLEAVRDDADPEVRRTVRLLLAAAGEAGTAVALPADDLSDLGRVSLDAEGPASTVLAALGALHGATFLLPDAHPDDTIELRLGNEPFFVALGRILEAARLEGRQGFDASGRMVLTPVVGEEVIPWAAAGPMRVRVAEVTSTRTLGAPHQRRYVLAVDLHWTPAVQLSQYSMPTIVKAVGADGREYAAGASMRSRTTYGLGSTSRSARLNLHLERAATDETASEADPAPDPAPGVAPDPAPDPRGAPARETEADRLAELVFTLPVVVRRDRREVRFEDPLRLELPATRTHEGGEKVTLSAVGPPETERGFWTYELAARLTSEEARRSLLVLVEGPDGQIRNASSGSRFPSADGTVTLRARAYGRADEEPFEVQVLWYGRQDQGELRFTLRDVPLR